MKLIIIIQTLIIIAGGYYVYLLSHPKEMPVSENSGQPIINITTDTEATRTGYIPPTENPPVVPIEASTSATGHSDVGMEFPTPDEDLQVR